MKFHKAGNNWWEGRSLSSAGVVTTSARDRAMRRGAMYGLLGVSAANAVGLDPMGATSLATDAAFLGFHGIAGMTAFNMGGRARMLGLGYMGIGAVNAMSPGNNSGPL